MNIIHITDLHYNSNSYEKFSQNNIIKTLCESLENIKNPIDIVVFTGDLVYTGTDIKDFMIAKEILLDNISKTLNITQDNIFVCAGNHDMDRSSKLDSLEDYFDQKINNLDDLYNFSKSKTQDYINSIATSKNYNYFLSLFYQDKEDNLLNDLYSVHKRIIGEKKIGIISLNSSWRSVDDTSNGKLLFPIHLLEDALIYTKDCDSKLLLIHHPIHWFKEFNQNKLQELIYKNCDIMFSGHIHESEMTTHYKYNNGILAIVSSASMTYDKNYIGYTLIDYDIDQKSKANVIKYKYINEFGKFVNDGITEINIPCGIEKKYQNDIRAKLNSKLVYEFGKASDLLLDNDKDENDQEIFLRLFNKPVLKAQSRAEISISEQSKIFDFDKILLNENNYLIYGHDKSGKSSLLKFIQITHLKKYSINGNIPFYIDFRELEKKVDNDWDIIKYMSKYFELSYEKTKQLIENHNFRLLVDNFDPHSYLFEVMNRFLTTYPNVNFIICCDHLTSRIVEEYTIDDRIYQKLYLHDITRGDIRTYLRKSSQLQTKNDDKLIDKIVSFCKQIELPLNYWTISIILLIHKKSQFDISKNIFNMLDLCVDEMLNKKFLTLTKSKLDFIQLKTICGKLSKFLLTTYPENIYSANYSEILIFLENEIKSNVRYRANAKEVLDYLILSGVLKTKDDSKITFRLNGVFEYFLAFHMSQDTVFKDHILNDDNVYLSFKNEMEIYSGIKNDDILFLKTIYDKTTKFFAPVNKEYRLSGTPDNNLKSFINKNDEDYTLKNIVRSIKTIAPLTEEAKDIQKDSFDPVSINSSIEKKKSYNSNILDSEIFERYVSVLARVYKTMDGINDEIILNEILDFLLETYLNFSFFLTSELEDNIDINDEDSKYNILEILNKFIPFISQITFSDSIANYNVEGIIINKIEELKKDHKNNQYKLFVLYFILMDIDESNIFDYTDEVLEYMHIGILRYSSILKLSYYFEFLGSRNNKLADFLKIRIEKGQLELNNKLDKSKLQQSLDKKRNLINFNNSQESK